MASPIVSARPTRPTLHAGEGWHAGDGRPALKTCEALECSRHRGSSRGRRGSSWAPVRVRSSEDCLHALHWRKKESAGTRPWAWVEEAGWG